MAATRPRAAKSRSRRSFFVAFFAVAPLVWGCAPSSAGLRDGDLPSGVAIAVQQNRSDLGPRRIQVVVENESTQDLSVVGVALDAEQFMAPAIGEDRPTTVAAGRTVNIPLLLPDPDCSVEDPGAVVHLEYANANGNRVTATVVPVDRFERLPQLRQEDCLREAVTAIAPLTIDRIPQVGAVGGRMVASLRVGIAPTGAEGSLTVDTVAGTTLVAIADPSTGEILPQGVIGAEIRGTDESSSFVVTLVPNRCDAHAIAEDKRGSILPFHVSTSTAGSGEILVAASEEVRASLYAFVRSACGG